VTFMWLDVGSGIEPLIDIPPAQSETLGDRGNEHKEVKNGIEPLVDMPPAQSETLGGGGNEGKDVGNGIGPLVDMPPAQSETLGEGGSEYKEAKRQGKRNVVLIIADDFRAGMPGVKTPNLSGIMADGVTFASAYTQYPLCNPSRASLLSGRKPDITGIYDLDTPTNQQTSPDGTPTLPKLLSDHGYFTLAGGKVFHGETNASAFAKIFSPSVIKPYEHNLCKNEMYQSNSGVRPFLYQRRKFMLSSVMCKLDKSIEFPDHLVANRALNELELLSRASVLSEDKGFFMAIGFTSTHLPWMVGDKYWDMNNVTTAMNDARLDVKKDIWDRPAVWPNASYEPGRVHGELFTRQTVQVNKRRALRHGYRASISQLDDLIGMVWGKVKSTGLADETMLIVTSDHGFDLGEYGHYGKRALDEGSTHVPLIIRCPWCIRSNGNEKVITKPVQLVDVYDFISSNLRLGGGSSQLAKLYRFGVIKNVEPFAISQVLRCKGDVCPNSIYPWKDFVSLMGYSIRSGEWRYVVWLPAVAHSNKLDINWQQIQSENLYRVVDLDRLELTKITKGEMRTRCDNFLRKLKENHT